MTQTEKALQLIDLCARLPYNTKIAYCTPDNTEVVTLSLATIKIIEAILVYTDFPISVKPYLRPMSSMTDEEKEELHKLHFSIRYEDWLNRYAKLVNYTYEDPIIKSYPNQKDYIAHDVNETICTNLIDWLNKHHFDYRGLIEKGLALEAPEGIYNI